MAQIMLLGIPADHNPEKPFLGQLTPLSTGDTVVTYSGITIPIGNGSGYSGWSGFSGPQGTSGYSGDSGFSGYSGFSGVQGFSGYSGASGRVGTSGFSGRSGLSGPGGYSGYSGFSGFSGLIGGVGISGASGYSGYSGYSGQNGASGYSGISGISGYSGVGGGGGKTISLYNDMFYFTNGAAGWNTVRAQRIFVDERRVDTSEDIKVTVRGQSWYWMPSGMYGYTAWTGNSDIKVTLYDQQGTPSFVSGFAALPDVGKRSRFHSPTDYPDYTQDSYVNFELDASALRTIREVDGDFWTLKAEVYNPSYYFYMYATTFYGISRLSGLSVGATPANELAGDTLVSRYGAADYVIEPYPSTVTLQSWKIRGRPTVYVDPSYVPQINSVDSKAKFMAVIAGDINQDYSFQAYFDITPKYTDGGVTTTTRFAPFDTATYDDTGDSVRAWVASTAPGLQYTVDLKVVQSPYIYNYGAPSTLRHAEVWDIG